MNGDKNFGNDDKNIFLEFFHFFRMSNLLLTQKSKVIFRSCRGTVTVTVTITVTVTFTVTVIVTVSVTVTVTVIVIVIVINRDRTGLFNCISSSRISLISYLDS